MAWELIGTIGVGLSVFLLVAAVLWPRRIRITVTNEPPRMSTAEAAQQAARTIKRTRLALDEGPRVHYNRDGSGVAVMPDLGLKPDDPAPSAMPRTSD